MQIQKKGNKKRKRKYKVALIQYFCGIYKNEGMLYSKLRRMDAGLSGQWANRDSKELVCTKIATTNKEHSQKVK